MRHFLLTFLIVLFSMSFLLTDAQAKRFGGGRSFGMSRSLSRPAPINSFRPQQANPVSSGMNKWLGPLAGFAMGGLLASLFMGHGIGTGILTWLMVAGVILILWRLLQNLMLKSVRPAPFQAQNFVSNSYSSVETNQASKIDFDETAFLRQAKSTFIRMQTAYDEKNLTDIREFTAPQIFAEIQMQLQERGDEPNFTEVVSVDASIMEVAKELQSDIASVLFTAQIRESKESPIENVKEIWHFRKDVFHSAWKVAGIQQQ
jgi:predicted lipid-binding transport protein (Tim44 family)